MATRRQSDACTGVACRQDRVTGMGGNEGGRPQGVPSIWRAHPGSLLAVHHEGAVTFSVRPLGPAMPRVPRHRLRPLSHPLVWQIVSDLRILKVHPLTHAPGLHIHFPKYLTTSPLERTFSTHLFGFGEAPHPRASLEEQAAVQALPLTLQDEHKGALRTTRGTVADRPGGVHVGCAGGGKRSQRSEVRVESSMCGKREPVLWAGRLTSCLCITTHEPASAKRHAAAGGARQPLGVRSSGPPHVLPLPCA